MNTPASKPQSLIASLAIAISDIHLRLMSQDKYKNHRFASKDSLSDSDISLRESTLATAITEAVENATPMFMPTKRHLRSFLSIGVGDDFHPPCIDGFDELYSEVKEVLAIRNLIAMTSYDKIIDESLEKCDLIAKQAEQIAILEDQLAHSIELSEKRSVRVNYLLEQNDALEKKNEELVGLGPKHHWDDVVETDGDAMRRMSLPRSSPTADHSLADCIRVRDSLAMQLRESNSKRNGLEHTIGVLTNERNEFKERAYGEVSKIQQDVSAILKEFKIECPTNSIPDMVRSACEATRQHPQTTGDMDAIALKNSRGVTRAAVPERHYSGGVPRIDGANEAVPKPSILDGMAIDNVICGTLLLGSAFAAGYLAVKYMGLFQ